jgi:hypothetical protein
MCHDGEEGMTHICKCILSALALQAGLFDNLSCNSAETHEAPAQGKVLA